MKKFIFTLAFIAFALTNYAQTVVHVNGYTRSNGTYVESHYRTSPNDTKLDNWSTYPNVNPYTGNVGTRHYSENNFSNYNTPSIFSSPSSFSYPNTYINSYTSPSVPTFNSSYWGR
jgi:hypothetical protein